MDSPQPRASTSASSSPQASGSSTPASSTSAAKPTMANDKLVAAPSSDVHIMGDSTGSPAATKSEKRRLEDTAETPASDAKKPKVITNTSANSTPKPASKDAKGKGKPTPSSTVKEDSVPLELKNGKFVNKQKALKLGASMSATRARLEFTMWIADKIKEDDDFKLTEWPVEHHSVIATFIQESSQSLAGLVTSTKNDIVALVQGAVGVVEESQDEDSKKAVAALADRIPSAPIKALIETLATRNNYGLEVSDLPDGLPEDVKELPATLQVIAWENNDESLLPSEFEKQLVKRKNEREQIKTLAVDLFLGLSPPEQSDALHSKKSSKKAGASASTSTPSAASKKAAAPSSSSAAKPVKEKSAKKVKTPEEIAEAEEKAKAKAVKEEEKEARRLAKEAKAKEAEERKNKKAAEAAALAAKDEKTKNAKRAQANFMSMFVKKEKKSQSPALDASTSGQKESDFNRVFHPFTVRADVTLAPINGFPKGRAAAKGKGPEVKINSAATAAEDAMDDEEAQEKWRREALKSFISAVPKHHIPPYNPRPSPPVSIRQTVVAINESLLTGLEARDCYSILKDRTKVPVKLLKFHSDVRPGYVGTWTKKSKVIGPRTPFALDTQMLNYEVDSEEEWEEEEDDPNAEDVNSDGDRSDNEGEESEALSDDWMCDDDEVEYAQGFNEDDEMILPPDDDLIIVGGDSAARKKVEQREKKAKAAREGAKKRKAVGPLIPLVKGPIWEAEIGQVAYPPFAGMRLQFLNDAAPGLDPFRFISKPFTSAAVGKGKAVDRDSTAASEDAGSPSGSTSLDRKPSTSSKPAKPIPAHLMPELIKLVDDNGGQTKPILIQTIYDGLKKISGEIKVTKQMVGGAFGTLPIEKKKGDDPKAAARWTVSEATRSLYSAQGSAMVID